MQQYDDSATTMEPTTEAPAQVAAPVAPAPQPVTTATAALPPKKVAKPAGPPEYQMPPVRLNQRIIWRPDPTEEGELPGVAIKLGPNTISVLVFVEGSGAPVQIREGVRHITDKRWSRDAGEGGVWDYDQSDRELYEGLEELGHAFHAQGILLTGITHTVAEQKRQIEELTGRVNALAMAANPMPISEALRKVDLPGATSEPELPAVLAEIPETPPVQGPPAPPAKPNKHNR